jgi:hypothetical protein
VPRRVPHRSSVYVEKRALEYSVFVVKDEATAATLPRCARNRWYSADRYRTRAALAVSKSRMTRRSSSEPPSKAETSTPPKGYLPCDPPPSEAPQRDSAQTGVIVDLRRDRRSQPRRDVGGHRPADCEWTTMRLSWRVASRPAVPTRSSQLLARRCAAHLVATRDASQPVVLNRQRLARSVGPPQHRVQAERLTMRTLPDGARAPPPDRRRRS